LLTADLAALEFEAPYGFYPTLTCKADSSQSEITIDPERSALAVANEVPQPPPGVDG
jgi:hypothetical protein